MKLRFLLIVTLLLSSVSVFSTDSMAASPADGGGSIVEHITADSAITVIMPDALLQRVKHEDYTPEEEVKPVSGKMGGYRIQIFSDNNARTAKTEARTRARNLASRFPQYPTYVVYSSPYWRLRVGNFRTHDDANAAAAEIKEAFPRYSREIRVVRDRIVVSGD